MEQAQEKKVCAQCTKEKDIDEFYRTKNGRDGHMRLCKECHKGNLSASREAERLKWEQRERERAERERPLRERPPRELQEAIERERRERQERRQAELAYWFEKEPTRICMDCKHTYAITEFMFNQYDPLDFWREPNITPFQRCRVCHQAMRDKRLLPCVLCEQPIRSRGFEFLGYRVDRAGFVIRVVCDDCLEAFQSLPAGKQRFYIQSRCKQLYPYGQVIYIHRDPRDQQIRYVGRTNDLKRRTQDHLKDSYPYEPREVQGEIVPYYKSNWWYDLLQLGKKPLVETVAHIEPSPRVIEWETRYILHYIRQGAPLLNTEARDQDILARMSNYASLDFLAAPFEALVEAEFFRPHSIEAFIHKWYS
ncbi:GIY-YIG nuclease family protein [Ktedonobacter robiniae]|uniref:GIY-YIG domain-containing protein n=1 Tax=Ktedonobacter robiniae TaxID=2778365 RepID=A0ABQ3USS6_9CHLR|nr:GIY-YIG nuclease family protein [Ktedonobacter robiniae]GHO55794.1 hypothetical protein KSB_42690 [Ktedonobacter robiniae]